MTLLAHVITVLKKVVLSQPGRGMWMGVMIILLYTVNITAQVYTSSQSGYWNDPATWGGSDTPGPGNTVIINHLVTVTTAASCDNLQINGTLQLTDEIFIVNGTTTVNGGGILDDNHPSGDNIFKGKVTVNNSGTWKTNVHGISTNEFFEGGIENNGSFIAGGCTFRVNNQSLTGTSFSFEGPVRVDNGIILTNQASVTIAVGKTLNGNDGSSKWINDAGATLVYQATTEPMSTGDFVASSVNNKVEYRSSSNQNIADATPGGYYNLVFSGTGEKLISTNVGVKNSLELNCNQVTVDNSTRLTLGTDAATPGILNYISGTINGRFERWINSSDTYLFPVGTSTNNHLVTLTPGGAIATGHLVAEYVSTNPSPGWDIIDNHFTLNSLLSGNTGYWLLTPDGGFNSSSFGISLKGSGFTDISEETRIINQDAAGVWGVSGTHVNAASETAYRNDITTGLHATGTGFALANGSCVTITTQPSDQNVCTGANVTLSVVATGASLTYQWYKDGSEVTGATNSSLLINNISTSEAGDYYCKIANNCNTGFYSDTVDLAVNTDPSWGALSFPTTEICNGGQVTFSTSVNDGMGGLISWVRSTISGGAGTTVTSPDTPPSDGTYYYRPQYTPTGTGCNLSDGTETTVTVNPMPSVTTPILLDTICNGASTTISLTSNVTGTTYAWTMARGGFGSSDGSGSLISQTLNLPGSYTAYDSVIYRVVPTGPAPTFCVGSSKDFKVFIEPTVTITAASDTLCNNGTTSITPASSNNTTKGIRYTWAANDPSNKITGEASSAGNGLPLGKAISQALQNTDSVPRQIIYTITPHAIRGDSSLRCAGTPVSVTIWVEPTVVLRAPGDTICNGATTHIIPTSGYTSTNGIVYTWTVTDDGSGKIGGYSPSSSGLAKDVALGQQLTNSDSVAHYITYHITPRTLNNKGLLYCLGTTFDVMIWVEPTVAVYAKNDTICDGATVIIKPVSGHQTTKGIRYTWTVSPNPNILGAGSSSSLGNDLGNSIVQTLKNTTDSKQKITYTITPWAIGTQGQNKCAGVTRNVDVWIEPTPKVLFSVEDTICNQEPITFQVSSPSVPTGTMVYNLVTTPSDSITGYKLSVNNDAINNFNNTLNNTSFNLQQVTYRFTPKIRYANSSKFCMNGKDTTITVKVNPTPRVYVSLPKGQSSSLDSVCFNQGTVLQITTPNQNVIGTVKYDLAVTYETDSVINVATAGRYGIANLNQATMQNVSAKIQKVTYTLTPLIENVRKNTNCNNGVPVTRIITIVPEILYNFKPRAYVGGYNISCNDSATGSAKIKDLKGGLYTSPYTYKWSNGVIKDSISAVKAGNYSLTVTDKLGCFTAKSITLTQPNKIQTIDSVKHVTCSGSYTGNVNITTQGGVSPYRYKWTKAGMAPAYTEDLYSINAGYYTVNVTDTNKCTFKKDIVVNQSKDIVWSVNMSNYNISPLYNISCKGRSDGYLQPIFKNNQGPIVSYNWVGPGGFNASTKDISNLKAGEYRIYVVDSMGCKADFRITLTEPDSLMYTKSVPVYSNNFNIKCEGEQNGRIFINSVQGGITPYTYQWSTIDGNGLVDNVPVQSNLGPGKYKLTIKDKYCSVADSFTLIQPDKLNVNSAVPAFNGYEVACNQGKTGTISLDVSGGYGGYTYIWNGTGTGLTQGTKDQNGLSAGSYQVTVTYGGLCPKTYSFILKEPDPIKIDATRKANITCFGNNDGYIYTRISGGLAPYSYYWTTIGGKVVSATDSIQPHLTAGQYTVEVTDKNLCKVSHTTLLTQPDSFIVNLSTMPINCADGTNGSITANSTGGTAPFVYSWSNNRFTKTITGLTIGGYSVTVTDANKCKASAMDSVRAPAALNVIPAITSNYNGSNISCYGAKDGSISLKINGGSAPYQYRWSTQDTSQSISNLGANTYQVTVTDKNGCKGIPPSITLTQPEAVLLRINSFKNLLCHGVPEGAISVEGRGGVLPYRYVWSSGHQGADIQQLTAGNYTVTMYDANNCRIMERVTLTQPDTIRVTVSAIKPTCPDAGDGEIDLSIHGGVGSYRIQWDNNQTSSFLGNLRPTMYIYRITDDNNCVLRDTIDLQPRNPACIDIPSAFSPNGDLINDKWEILAGDPKNPVYVWEMYPDAIVEVFTRWGTLVFRSEPGYRVPWDGNYQGRELPLDSYYYVINPKNGTRPIKGIVTIIK